jgi:DNA-binding transcriptional regulator YhcF (GntR family)
MMRQRITEQLNSGATEHGDRLPSVRELAEELGVHSRAVVAAYHQLVEEGLVEIRSRSGVYVTGALTLAGDAVTIPRRWLLETLLEAVQRNVPLVRLAEHIHSSITARRLCVAVIECNEDQLDSMSYELRTYLGLRVIAIPLESLEDAKIPPPLANVDLLVSSAHEEIIARIAATIRKPYVMMRVRPALTYRLSRLLARGGVYLLVVDPRFGIKMRRLVAPMAASENFHVLVVNQDDLAVIPDGAPTYAMRIVQQKAANRKHRGSEITPQRMFSDDTIRDILSWMLATSDG